MYCKNSRFLFFYRIIVFALALYTVLAHFSLTDMVENDHNFIYFTVQSNLLCLITYGLLLYPSARELKTGDLNFRNRYCFLKSLATLTILVTGIGFQGGLMRVPAYRMEYLPLTPESFLGHYIMPVAVCLDWILFQPKGKLDSSDPILWCLYPCLYYIMLMLRILFGNESMLKAAGAYPYAFLDVGQFGLSVLFYAGLILASFLLAGYFLVFLDHMMGVIIAKRTE